MELELDPEELELAQEQELELEPEQLALEIEQELELNTPPSPATHNTLELEPEELALELEQEYFRGIIITVDTYITGRVEAIGRTERVDSNLPHVLKLNLL